MYKSEIQTVCKWLDIKVPHRIFFIPAEMDEKRDFGGRYHNKKNIILILIPSSFSQMLCERVIRTITHEIIHFYQNQLGMDMSNNNEREIEAIALTNAYMLDRNSQNVTVGKVREYFSRTSGGNAPE